MNGLFQNKDLNYWKDAQGLSIDVGESAQKLAQRLMEAPIDTGGYADFIHPEKRERIASRSHPLADNPAYPQFTPTPGQQASNWEELLASEQYQATLQRLTKFLADVDPRRKDPNTGQPKPIRRNEVGSIMQGMMMAVMQAMALEDEHKEQLEKMAIDLIFEQPEFKKLKVSYENGDFTIDAQLGPANLENARLSPEQGGPGAAEGGEEEQAAEGGEAPEPTEPEDVEREERAMGELGQFDLELAKRKVINAMIHGGAVSKNYAYQLISQELSQISPKLLGLYGLAMAGSELGYFMMPDEMAAQAMEHPELQGGSSEIEFGEEEEGSGKPVVHARGLIFPMLVQELAKGLLELVSYEGLPEDPQMAQDVIDKADLVDQESWAMIMGRGLWTRFVNALGGDEDEITMHLYNRIVQMPPENFNRIMQSIQAGGKAANDTIKRLAQDLRMDMEAQDRDESGFAGSSEEEPPEYPEGQEPWR